MKLSFELLVAARYLRADRPPGALDHLRWATLGLIVLTASVFAGSELVEAVGDLLRRRGNPARAAATVRADTRRLLAERLGLGPEPSPVAMVEIVSARTGRPPDQVGPALYGDPGRPTDDAASLVALVRTLDAIRQEVLDVAHR